MVNNYGGVIWTNHALDRLSERGISQENALKTFRNPDSMLLSKDGDSYRYTKQFGEKKVTLIGKQNEEKEWIILSAWVDPPPLGSKDERQKKAYLEYKKATGWRKIFLAVKRQVGF